MDIKILIIEQNSERIVFASEKARKALRYSGDNILNLPIRKIIQDFSISEYFGSECKREDNSVFSSEIFCENIDCFGKPHVLVSIVDLDKRKLESRYTSAVSSNTEKYFVYFCGRDGDFEYISDSYKVVLQTDSKPESFDRMLVESDRNKAFNENRRLSLTDKISYFEVDLVVNGQLVTFELREKPVYENNFLIGIEGIAIKKTGASERKIVNSVMDIMEGMIVTDSQCRITRINAAFTEITGYTEDEVIGKNPSFLQSKIHPKQFFVDMWDSINKGGKFKGKILNKKKSNEVYLQNLTISTIKDEYGNVVNYIGLLSDITNELEQTEKINRLAFYDPLTNLPNRKYVVDWLESAIDSSHQKKTIGAVIYIDLDNFKNLNDNFGHDAGDSLLIKVAQRLSAAVSTNDIVGRMGGDEFLIVLAPNHESEVQAEAHVKRVVSAIQAEMKTEFAINDKLTDFTIECSLGGAFFGFNICDYDSVKDNALDVIRKSDMAMYQSKNAGKNLFSFFDNSLYEKARLRHKIEKELRQALEHDELELYLQPQVNSKKKIVGAELLIRWNHPQDGILSPFVFMPIAEESYLIHEIGLWVVRQACNIIDRLESDNVNLEHISFNVSPKQFSNVMLKKALDEILKNNQFAYGKLMMELTEEALLNIDSSIDFINHLSDNGMRISIDDFGTGYSSLIYLKKLPINEIKIDKSFVQDMNNDPNDEAIVKAIIALAKELNVSVVAEGVENTEIESNLLKYGCDFLQGYFYSKPIRYADFVSLYKGRES